jgi:hypothetical protein
MFQEDHTMSIVRVGLAETKKFAEGYEAIFGKKKEEESKPEENQPQKSEEEQKKEEEKR